MANDINKKPFDEPTLVKLGLFEQYLIEWLPVFIHGFSRYSPPRLAIWDFFAGSGQDSAGHPGSPLLILNTLSKFEKDILGKNARVLVVLNEGHAQKAAELESMVKQRCENWSLAAHVEVRCHNEAFRPLFERYQEELGRQANLVFMDQYGLKEVDKSVFMTLSGIPRTDFLFFLSSSYARRFHDVAEMKRHYPTSLLEALRQADQKHVHRMMRDYYQSLVPEDSDMRLYPFTLAKGANIFGVLFGSAHPLGWEKFLRTAWERNPVNGEANFDIDDDIGKQDSLFKEDRAFTKRMVFERDLEAMLLNAMAPTNLDAYRFALERGHPGAHAAECVHRLKKAGKLAYSRLPGFSYASCIKNKKIVPLKVAAHGRE